jgi:DNA-dependent RNA polymerase auxiliary subunit epsilon
MMFATDAHNLVLLSLLLSLFLVFRTMSAERILLYQHHQALKDMNEGRLTRFEQTLYLQRLMDAFLSQHVQSAFVRQLHCPDPFSVEYLKIVHRILLDYEKLGVVNAGIVASEAELTPTHTHFRAHSTVHVQDQRHEGV